VAAAAIAVAALVIERTALGGDLATSRARLRARWKANSRRWRRGSIRRCAP
jgi:hypothetical protein